MMRTCHYATTDIFTPGGRGKKGGVGRGRWGGGQVRTEMVEKGEGPLCAGQHCFS